MTAQINAPELLVVFNKMVAQEVAYEMGAKAPSLDCDVSELDTIDCSGCSRLLLAKSSNQEFIIPDGSANQHDWFEAKAEAGQIHKLAHYSDVQYAANDPKRAFIAFIAPGAEGPGEAGHVWIVYMGKTLESHGGWKTDDRPHGIGCNSRNWDYATLKNFCCACYELPCIK